MVGADVKQTRCTTCDAEHEFKHAKVPRQRRKPDAPAALYAQALAGGPKRVVPEAPPDADDGPKDASMDEASSRSDPEPSTSPTVQAAESSTEPDGEPRDAEPPREDETEQDPEQGPAHRRLIRATLPRPEGQPPPTRPAPEFTIRQPAGRQGRFRPRHQRGSPFHNGPNPRSGNVGGGMPRQGGGRPPMMSRSGKRHGHPPGGGRKRSK